MVKDCFIGIDVGSVSTNIVLTDTDNNITDKLYIRTEGQPVKALCRGMSAIAKKHGDRIRIKAAGTTGSGRKLAALITGADAVKNEITAHATAAKTMIPEVQTILEIGGQDSKIILLRNGVVHDFAMNTVCAAGTGSFLDRQAARLGIDINELGTLALKSDNPVRIAGRCAVFAESDMIHKQQNGHCIEDIVAGLCEALVRNYLNNLGKGKDIKEKIVFQGGVAANAGITAAFEKALGCGIIVPEHFDVMGAYGAAVIAGRTVEKDSAFRGFKSVTGEYTTRGIKCEGCSNLCEVVEIISDGCKVACWGDRCGKWSGTAYAEQTKDQQKLG